MKIKLKNIKNMNKSKTNKINDTYNPYGVSSKMNIVLHILSFLFMVVCIAPVILVVMVSITSEHSLTTYGYSFIPKEFSLISYRFLLSDAEVILRAYGVTITMTVVGTLVGVTIMALYAYPLSRNDFPFKKFFTVYIFFTMIFSGGLAPFYIVYTRYLNLRNTIIALILPSVFGVFNVFMVRTFFKSTIPQSMIEAAKIDGASELGIFWKIVIPLSKPVLATIGLFTTIGYWNKYMHSLLFIDNEKLYSLQFVMMRTMLQLQYLQSRVDASPELRNMVNQIPNEGMRMAMVVLGMGPIILAYPWFQKYFVKGLTVGSIKG
ncbi:MAG: carbohydrate ABC transporter permease [bacterium]